MSFLLPQPSVPALPSGIDLTSQTALVTGPTSGVGLAIAHALLSANLTTLVLAARSESKANSLRDELLSAYPHAKIEVFVLDTGKWESVQSFCAAVQERQAGLDLVFLNAGLHDFSKEFSPTGHDRMLQVNYLSNVILTLRLLPLLSSTAAATGRPSRLTWTSSTLYNRGTLTPLPKDPLFKYIDSTNPGTLQRYANSKFLGILFNEQVASRVSADSVIINSFCPGSVDTNLGVGLPIPIRWIIKGVKQVTGRSPDVGARIALNAGVVAGKESHGGLFEDMKLSALKELKTETAQQLSTRVWNETLDEVSKYTAIPSWCGKI